MKINHVGLPYIFSTMKQKLLWSWFAGIFLLSFGLHAQTRYEDVVYLKNGSVIHGIIIEQVPNESIKIKTSDRNVFVYRMEEIAKIAREEIPGRRKIREPLTRDNIKKKGYSNITEVSIGRDVLDNGSNEAVTGSQNGTAIPSICVQTINGYQFSPYISLGLGLGLHTYTELAFVPLFADIHFYFQDGPMSLYFSFDGGYSFSANEVYGIYNSRKYFGGVFYSPALGVRMYTRKSKALGFSLGYQQQQARNYNYSYGKYYYTTTIKGYNSTIGYLMTKVSFIF